METIKRTFKQFLDLYQSMTPSQRATLIVVPVMIVASFYFVVFIGSSSSYVPLSWGKIFTYEELRSAEQTLIEAGMDGFETRGQRLLAPKKDVERYNAALLQGGALPENSMSELEKQLKGTNIFTSQYQFRAREGIALRKELARTIQAVPGIEKASVNIARPDTVGWGGKQKPVTATVSVNPRRGRDISMELVHSIRAAVAAAVADLKPENVTIFDLSKGIAHSADKEGDPFDSRLLTRKRSFERQHQEKIATALSYIPDVVVLVNVDLDKIKSSVAREQLYDPKKLVTIQTTEQIRTDELRQQSSRAEPGSVSNQPLGLETAPGNGKTRNVSETNTATLNVPSWKITKQEFIAAFPENVQVTVGIPHDYFKQVAAEQGLSAGETEEEQRQYKTALAAIETTEKEKAQSFAMTLIPADSPATAVRVDTIFPSVVEIPEVPVPLTDTLSNALSQWGGAVGLTFFALWALWMLNKSMPRISEIDAPRIENAVALHVSNDDDDEEEEEIEKVPDERDKIQTVVRDNPEMAAAVLSKWIHIVK